MTVCLLKPLRIDFLESKYFRGREDSLKKQGFKLVIFHVLRKAIFKINEVVKAPDNKKMVPNYYPKVLAIVKNVEVKEKHTYYKLQDMRGRSMGWYYEQDLEKIMENNDPLGR